MGLRANRVIKIEAEIWIAANPEVVFAAFAIELDAWWPLAGGVPGRIAGWRLLIDDRRARPAWPADRPDGRLLATPSRCGSEFAV